MGPGNHDTGAVTEDAHESGTETTSGTLSFSDVDLTDHHSVTGVTPSSGALGTLTASVTHDTTGAGTGGVLTWNYSVADSAIDHLAAGQTKVETFTVSLFDGTSTVTKDVTVTITGLTPTVSVSISGTPQEGQTLTANATTNDVDATITYNWYNSADNYRTAIGTGSTYVVKEADEGFQIHVVATTSDPDNSSTSAATNTVTDITLAFTSAASITGTAQEGQTLTAVNGTLNDSDAAVTSYQWQKSTDGFAHFTIIGSNSATYDVQGSDEGSQIGVVETASDTDNGGFTTSVTSAATAAVIDETPSITVSISGTAEGGHTLHAVVSGFEDDDTLTYQWQSSSDGGHTWSNITDATSACYQVQEWRRRSSAPDRRHRHDRGQQRHRHGQRGDLCRHAAGRLEHGGERQLGDRGQLEQRGSDVQR